MKKGYFIESLIDNETIKNSFQSYFVKFKHQYVENNDFKNYFIEFSKNNIVTNETLNKIDTGKYDGEKYL